MRKNWNRRDKSVPADVYARRYGFRTSEVLYKIRAGILDGAKVNDEWHVLPIRSAASSQHHIEDDPTVGDEQASLSRQLHTWFAPRYDELTLLTMSTTFLWLLFVDPDVRDFAIRFAFQDKNAASFLMYSAYLGGAILAFLHAFSRRSQSELERELVLAFAVGMHVTAAWNLSLATEPEPGLLNIVLWVWNFASGLILLLLYRFRIVNASAIADGDADTWQSLAALLVTLGLVTVGSKILDLHWATTLSVCIGVSSTLSRLLDQLRLQSPHGVTEPRP